MRLIKNHSKPTNRVKSSIFLEILHGRRKWGKVKKKRRRNSFSVEMCDTQKICMIYRSCLDTSAEYSEANTPYVVITTSL